jgi:hypothetical protein
MIPGLALAWDPATPQPTFTSTPTYTPTQTYTWTRTPTPTCTFVATSTPWDCGCPMFIDPLDSFTEWGSACGGGMDINLLLDNTIKIEGNSWKWYSPQTGGYIVHTRTLNVDPDHNYQITIWTRTTDTVNCSLKLQVSGANCNECDCFSLPSSGWSSIEPQANNSWEQKTIFFNPSTANVCISLWGEAAQAGRAIWADLLEITDLSAPTCTPTPTPTSGMPDYVWQDYSDNFDSMSGDDKDLAIAPTPFRVIFDDYPGSHFGQVVRRALNPASTPVFLPYQNTGESAFTTFGTMLFRLLRLGTRMKRTMSGVLKSPPTNRRPATESIGKSILDGQQRDLQLQQSLYNQL